MDKEVTDEHYGKEWWHENDPKKETTNYWDEGIDSCIAFNHKDSIQHMKPGVDLTKSMLDHIAMYDTRWKQFKKEWFNTGKYELHAKLNFHVRYVVQTKQKAE